jgi:4-diphosphocytidyl-2-C-methyl-D-erythritol kinase
MSDHRIRLSCPAKLNLHLEIKGQRPDGYHELLMLNTAIDLADEVEIELGGDGLRLICGHPGVPAGDDNLCIKAARAFFHACPGVPPAATIRLTKRIPVAGGLGGGSSNAAAVLAGLQALLGAPLGERELMRLAVGLGADVPFFLGSSPSRVEGIGERLTPAPALPDWHYLLVCFPFGVSTAWAFHEWDLTSAPSCAKFLQVSVRGEKANIPMPGTWRNDLQHVVTARHPQVEAARSALLAAGAVGAMMSGSGPTVFGILNTSWSSSAFAALEALGPGITIIPARAVRKRMLIKID